MDVSIETCLSSSFSFVALQKQGSKLGLSFRDARICVFMSECGFSPCGFVLLAGVGSVEAPAAAQCPWFMTTVLPWLVALAD